MMKDKLQLLDEELSSYVKLNERELQPSQKEAMFETSVLKDYRRRIWMRRFGALSCVAVIVAASCLLLPSKPAGIDVQTAVADNFLAVDIPQGVTVVSSCGTVTNLDETVRLMYADGYARFDGGDSLELNPSEGSYILVSDGCKCITKLSDGSIIELNGGSRLSIPSGFGSGSRMVKISGEAFFNVSHNENLPFVVDAGKVRTKVLGTEFLVNSYPGEEDRAFVALYQGKVTVELPFVESDVELSPDELLSVSGESYILTSSIPDELSSWRPCNILELHEPLNVLLDKVADYYNINIHCSDELDGVFCHGRLVMTSTPEELFATLSKLVPIRYRFQDDNNIIITKTH